MSLSLLPENPKSSAARPRTPTSPCQRAGFRHPVEALEGRRLFSTLIVTSTLDSGPGSLRDAIAAAQSGDTIVFSSTLSTSSTVSGSSTLLTTAMKSSSTKKGHGKPTPTPPPPPPPTPPRIALTSGELLLTKDLTIQGPGAGQLTISGSAGGNERAFEVGQTATVSLSGLTISGTSSYWASQPAGAPWAGYGGGILNHGTLTVSGCTVSGHIDGYAEGGGIFSDGTLNLNASTVSGCWAEGGSTSGGGISNWGTAMLTNTVISNNMADPDASLSYPWFNKGGGILNRGTMTLNGCTVSGNNARTAGGGIFNFSGGTLTLNSSKVSGNGSNYGGGVYNAGAMTLGNASTITANGATYGNDVDNLGSLNVLDTSTIGSLDSVVAFLEPV